MHDSLYANPAVFTHRFRQRAKKGYRHPRCQTPAGSRRISEVLSDRGVTCAPSKIRRIMAQLGLHALQPKNFVPKTSDGRADRPSPNLLSGKPIPEALNSVWAGDITFIPTSVGWLYLAVVIDLCSRRVVGWSLADHMRSDLVLDALNQALGTRSPNRTIFHSDRGSQYASTLFRKVLSKAGMRQSMSARANPYENAWTESFIGTLKLGMLQISCTSAHEPTDELSSSSLSCAFSAFH